MISLFYAGSGETFKGDCHAAMGVLAAAFTLYNLSAWLLRREPHLARNVGIYGALTLLEIAQTRKHRDG